MADFNAQHNRAVWFDIPVADLDRAIEFYSRVCAMPVEKQEYDGYAFAVMHHTDGNGGCLVPKPEDITDKGILVYMNAEGRIREATRLVGEYGGTVVEDVHSIGPHGFRTLLVDSEGNRLALHSSVDG